MGENQTGYDIIRCCGRVRIKPDMISKCPGMVRIKRDMISGALEGWEQPDYSARKLKMSLSALDFVLEYSDVRNHK